MAARLLPYGSTLHYPGCGCPSGWRTHRRLADAVDSQLQAAVKAMQSGRVVPSRKLNVAYMLPHHNVTGGMKCLVEHIRLLKTRGHRTIAVHRSDAANRAMPPWTSVEADVDIVCRLNQQLQDVFDVSTIDVVVVGIFHQVAELLLGLRAPILYWEQGHEWIFGDPVRFQTQHNYLKQDQLFHIVMQLPVALAGVSTAVQEIMQQEFRRSSVLIPNSIDCERFRPGTPDENPALANDDLAASSAASSPRGNGNGSSIRRALEPSSVEQPPPVTPLPRVLLVGNPSLPLKGFDTALAALESVNSVLPIRVTWVCQVAPKASTFPALSSSKLKINYVVSPAQEEIPKLYRGHDAFLFTSRYEAWGMPVMEAMASGLAVVTTNCLGVTSFAEPGVNCMLADANDAAMCAKYLLQVLTSPELREKLQTAGRATALKFKPELVLDQLENVLYSLASCSSKLLEIRQQGAEHLEAACVFAAHACLPQPLPSKQPLPPGALGSRSSSMQGAEHVKQQPAGPHIDWQLMQMQMQHYMQPLLVQHQLQLNLLLQQQQQQQQTLLHHGENHLSHEHYGHQHHHGHRYHHHHQQQQQNLPVTNLQALLGQHLLVPHLPHHQQQHPSDQQLLLQPEMQVLRLPLMQHHQQPQPPHLSDALGSTVQQQQQQYQYHHQHQLLPPSIPSSWTHQHPAPPLEPILPPGLVMWHHQQGPTSNSSSNSDRTAFRSS